MYRVTNRIYDSIKTRLEIFFYYYYIIGFQMNISIKNFDWAKQYEALFLAYSIWYYYYFFSFF